MIISLTTTKVQIKKLSQDNKLKFWLYNNLWQDIACTILAVFYMVKICEFSKRFSFFIKDEIEAQNLSWNEVQEKAQRGAAQLRAQPLLEEVPHPGQSTPHSLFFYCESNQSHIDMLI